MMRCPKCDSILRSISTRTNKRTGLHTRTRVCENENCNHKIFTVEIPRYTYQATFQLVKDLEGIIGAYIESCEEE